MPPHQPPSLFSMPISNTTLVQEPTVATKAALDKDTLIAFDWDDTLLCSSFLSSKGLRLDSDPAKVKELESQLTELSHSIIAVLSLALQYGPVTVVTNAETGWVQLSCQKFIPLVLPMLNKLTIISARSTYEPMFPGSPLKWKYYCFQERINALAAPGSKREKNVLSFGDSHVEREAVRACTRGMTNTRTKSVKFAERPSMEQLRRQIELVTNCFQYIHNHEGDLDLQLTVTVNGTNSPSNGASAGQKASDGTESKAMYGNQLNHNSNPLTTSEEKPNASM
jgi:hypothetical protein